MMMMMLLCFELPIWCRHELLWIVVSSYLRYGIEICSWFFHEAHEAGEKGKHQKFICKQSSKYTKQMNIYIYLHIYIWIRITLNNMKYHIKLSYLNIHILHNIQNSHRNYHGLFLWLISFPTFVTFPTFPLDFFHVSYSFWNFCFEIWFHIRFRVSIHFGARFSSFSFPVFLVSSGYPGTASPTLASEICLKPDGFPMILQKPGCAFCFVFVVFLFYFYFFRTWKK